MLTINQFNLSKYGYFFQEELSIDELYSKFSQHRRLKVFVTKGLRCVVENCNHIGSRLIQAIDKLGNKHIDLYTDNLMMMTIDHILPVSKGGNNELDNLQPMCYLHNNLKGNESDPLISSKEEKFLLPINTMVNSPDGEGKIIGFHSRSYFVHLNDGRKRNYSSKKVFEL